MKRKSGSFPPEFSLKGVQRLKEEHCQEKEDARLETMQKKRHQILEALGTAILDETIYVVFTLADLDTRSKFELIQEITDRFPNHVYFGDEPTLNGNSEWERMDCYTANMNWFMIKLE